MADGRFTVAVVTPEATLLEGPATGGGAAQLATAS